MERTTNASSPALTAGADSQGRNLLSFRNPVGLAAGFEKTGAGLSRLAQLGFGHIEIGTITDRSSVTVSRRPGPGPLIGVNFASAREGVGAETIEDYCRCLSRLWGASDFLTANLTSPRFGRNADTHGVDLLIDRLKREQEHCQASMGLRRPLLVKMDIGPAGSPLPRAVLAAHHCEIDGIVAVSDSTRRLAEICRFLKGRLVVSVGGIACSHDVRARLAAGAHAVQIYSAFVQGGREFVSHVLDGLRAT